MRSDHSRLYEAITCTARHAPAVAALDAAWVAEGTTLWRKAALTEAEVISLAGRADVIFKALIDCSAGSDGGEAVVGFAWCVLVPNACHILREST